MANTTGTFIDLDLLFDNYYERLVYFSIQIIKDKQQAEDISQDAFISYWKIKDNIFQHQTAIKNFLYSYVKNASLNVLRHAKVHEKYALENANTEAITSTVIDAIITSEILAELYSAIESLPKHYQLVTKLGFLEGKSNPEIAEQLNIPLTTVKKQKQRALQLLRLHLKPELFILLTLINTIR